MIKENYKILVKAKNNVMGVKLVTGEEVMAKVTECPQHLKLELPHSIVSVDEGVAFTPWPSMIDESATVLIKKDKVLLTFSLRGDFYREYAEMHVAKEKKPSGIYMPKDSPIVTEK